MFHLSVSDLTKAMIQDASWQDLQGILLYKSKGTHRLPTCFPKQSQFRCFLGAAGHGRVVRSFTTVYELSGNDTALQDYIRAFVAVQVRV